MTTHHRVTHDVEGRNSGTWPVVTPEHFITPIERFFIRSHAPAPAIDPDTFHLEIDGLVNRPLRFPLKELQARFARHSVDATLVCAGLRRAEFLTLGPLPGELPWGLEPVSTGSWAGVRLSDVLRAAEIVAGARYVEFTGLDQVEREGVHFGFGGCIDLEKALAGDVLLATELNGAPLPPMHGFPLRAVVPGWIGARSVKWLGRITLCAEPSKNYFQSKAYRTQRVLDPEQPRDVSAGDALGEVPLNAVMIHPADGAEVVAGAVTVRGWAMGSASRPLTSVQVSADGNEWYRARLTVQGSVWTWSFWEAVLQLAAGPHTLAVRATDSEGTTQPAELSETWNVKGYANNAWHRVNVVAR
ncbi:MAG: sulfite oxidase [Gemmatimonadaceae bacterium]